MLQLHFVTIYSIFNKISQKIINNFYIYDPSIAKASEL